MNERISELGSSSGLSLAVRLRGDSSGAWREMVELYGPLVERWCRVGRVPEDAIPDIAQEVFLAAFRGIANFDASRADATFRGWLWTVARSRIVEYYRRSRRQAPAPGGSTALQQINALQDPIPQEEPTEPGQMSAVMHCALEQIRGNFAASTWNLFWRSAVAGHPTDMVASEFGVSPAAVRQARSRVLRRLRRQLGDL